MMRSLRALTLAMSTATDPVPTPYSAPRRAVCAAWALATRVLVGMHPVLTQVPPIVFALDDGDGLTGVGEPAGQRRARLPGADDDRVEPPGHDEPTK